MKTRFYMSIEEGEYIEKLTDEQAGILFRAIMVYERAIAEGVDPELPDMDIATDIVFTVIRKRLDAEHEAYEETCRKRSKAAKDRWENANASEEDMQKDANAYEENMQMHANAYEGDLESDTDIDIDNDKLKEKVSSNEDTKKKSAKRFVPPTVQEVASYVREKGLVMDPQRFVDFYTSNGWMVGKNRMKDWKAAARGWAARDKSGGSRAAPTKFSNFSERKTDYDELERQLIRKSMGLGG